MAHRFARLMWERLRPILTHSVPAFAAGVAAAPNLRAMDSNGDGRVSAGEAIDGAIRRADLDGDGKVSPGEVTDIILSAI